jgi:hypothetical protein
MAERRIETGVEINAPASRVWAVLTDFARYPAWNPFITAIAGKPAAGEWLSITIRPPGKFAITMRPTLVAVTPERELRWLGHLIVSGIVDGEHFFLLEPLAEDRTRLIHGENFSGLLIAVMGGMFAAVEAGFEAMNTALKQKTEQP